MLRVVGTGGALDATTRDFHVRMIRHIKRCWGLQPTVARALNGRAMIEDMPDDELIALHATLRQARERIDGKAQGAL